MAVKKKDEDTFGHLRKGTWDTATKFLDKAGAFAFEKEPDEIVPTFSIALDLWFKGGWWGGRMGELSGDPETGKTTLALVAAAAYHRAVQGRRRVLVQDFERTCDDERMADIVLPFGINPADIDPDPKKRRPLKERSFIYHKPDYAEDGIVTALRLLATGEVGFYVLDSITAVRTKAATKAAIEGRKVQKGLHAGIIGRFVYDAFSLCDQHKTTWLCVNQKRDSIDIGKWGAPSGGSTYTTGGRAPRYQTSFRMELFHGSKKKAEEAGAEEDVRIATMRIFKNKISGKRGSFGLMMGIDTQFLPHQEAFLLGVHYGVIEKVKSGQGWKYRISKLKVTARPREKMIEWIKAHPSFRDLVRTQALVTEGILK